VLAPTPCMGWGLTQAVLHSWSWPAGVSLTGHAVARVARKGACDREQAIPIMQPRLASPS